MPDEPQKRAIVLHAIGSAINVATSAAMMMMDYGAVTKHSTSTVQVLAEDVAQSSIEDTSDDDDVIDAAALAGTTGIGTSFLSAIHIMIELPA